MRWKERFKETFHIKPGTTFDKVELNLDNTTCEDGGDLSGDIVVTVASEKIDSHGIFVRISGTEKSFSIVGRSVVSNSLLRLPSPLDSVAKRLTFFYLQKNRTRPPIAWANTTFPFTAPNPGRVERVKVSSSGEGFTMCPFLSLYPRKVSSISITVVCFCSHAVALSFAHQENKVNLSPPLGSLEEEGITCKWNMPPQQCWWPSRMPSKAAPTRYRWFHAPLLPTKPPTATTLSSPAQQMEETLHSKSPSENLCRRTSSSAGRPPSR